MEDTYTERFGRLRARGGARMIDVLAVAGAVALAVLILWGGMGAGYTRS